MKGIRVKALLVVTMLAALTGCSGEVQKSDVSTSPSVDRLNQILEDPVALTANYIGICEEKSANQAEQRLCQQQQAETYLNLFNAEIFTAEKMLDIEVNLSVPSCIEAGEVDTHFDFEVIELCIITSFEISKSQGKDRESDVSPATGPSLVATPSALASFNRFRQMTGDNASLRANHESVCERKSADQLEQIECSLEQIEAWQEALILPGMLLEEPDPDAASCIEAGEGDTGFDFKVIKECYITALQKGR